MANEVVLILAKRGGLADVEGVAYFRKIVAAIDSGLLWLDRHVDPDANHFDYRDIGTICMWQHVTHYRIVQGLDRYRRLAARVEHCSARPAVAGTTPEVPLTEAANAGWKPA